ncbi:efflux RND transporter permease subunit [Desulfobaculum bizertense]|uniref:Multidrug efflux pump subunit AcrB n=1 Tax=Desulfobaculum bizertense DSM 18034 TaxID=1121442 RepID=A0A1T4W4W9_9BACT|nr:efflux RND transporter permease subunit [Desulfobaculum bizertense]UIJ38645.1 efflux RND transporter permease subunit [Desulfobaculum bizertense]SKA72306.1 Multidrug efflux pump subunit AcrB [Desulfobaculum bizertense DSM 18034]
MSSQPKEIKKGPIAWMAGNSVAANLLMIICLVGGIVAGTQIKQEVFPEFTLDMVSVTIAYPGASPEEVEDGIILAVEEAVQGLEGIKKVESTANEGSASVMIEALDGADITRLWQDVKSEVDRITTLPDEAEDPQIVIIDSKRQVMTLALHGAVSELTLRESAEQVRDELLQQSAITQVELEGVRDYEITAEIPQRILRRYGLTLGDVAQIIQTASVELGGGSLKTSSGEILVRMKDRRNYAREYAQIPILTEADGSVVTLGDLAVVRDSFEESDTWAEFDGEPAVLINVFRVGDQTPMEVADASYGVVERLNQTFPEGVKLSVRRDMSKIFGQRADLLVRNAYMGLIIVFVFLALFLEIRLAFWISLGIPISFLGSFLLLPATDFSINMISMFAFIITLGIVVDDAIVVGENIFHKRQQGIPPLQAAIEGAREIAMPVTFSVLTNVVAFLPMYYVPGIMGKVFGIIPIVVLSVFAVSLVESLYVLPSHLGHSGNGRLWGPIERFERWQRKFSKGFENLVAHRYGAFLDWTLRYRYGVVAVGLALLIATTGYISSGRMGLVLFPKVESDFSFVEVTLPYGSPMSRVEKVKDKLVQAAKEVVAENGGERLSTGIYSKVEKNVLQARIFLTDPEVRPLSTFAVTDLWREKAGNIPGLESISFLADKGGPGSGKGLTIQLSHRNKELLDAAGRDLAKALENYPNVSDLDDGSAVGKRQFDFRLLPAGERLGLTSRSVANQVRFAFQGAEALSQQRGRNEVTVRVRLPREERELESSLENFVLRAPNGEEILLRDAATMIPGRAYTSINRRDGRRVISVTAEVTPASQAMQIVEEVKKNIMPDLVAQYPGLTFSFEGKQADIKDSVESLVIGLLLALLAVYALLAIPFKSYTQPFIIMVSIPFGIVGAVGGHILMGYTLSLMSLFGVVALSGVVVNDSLVLIDFANRKHRGGMTAFDSIHASGIYRFRPILLTTLTTFGGLAPMIFETSRQARFMIPMAISLGFGILFATTVTLILVPSLYMILEDIHNWFRHPDERVVHK